MSQKKVYIVAKRFILLRESIAAVIVAANLHNIFFGVALDNRFFCCIVINNRLRSCDLIT